MTDRVKKEKSSYRDFNARTRDQGVFILYSPRIHAVFRVLSFAKIIHKHLIINS